jgi:hypothetical protein
MFVEMQWNNARDIAREEEWQTVIPLSIICENDLRNSFSTY